MADPSDVRMFKFVRERILHSITLEGDKTNDRGDRGPSLREDQL